MTRFPLRRLRLRPGESQSDAVSDRAASRSISAASATCPCRTRSRRRSRSRRRRPGSTCRLGFDVRLHGPCMRCLADASLDVHVDAREYHAADAGADDELRSEYVVDDQLDLTAWARDAIALALPDQILHDPDCLGPLPRLREGSERRAARPRGRGARPALGGARGAPRAPLTRSASPHGPWPTGQTVSDSSDLCTVSGTSLARSLARVWHRFLVASRKSLLAARGRGTALRWPRRFGACP